MNIPNSFKAFLVFLAAVTLNACARMEPDSPDTPAAPQFTKFTLSARSGDDSAPPYASKSSRDAAGHFYWTPGDAVSLFRDGFEGNWKLTSTNSEPANPAEFSGQLPATATDAGGEFWAVYPYSTDNQFDGSTLTVSVPASQNASEGTFADGQFISIGHSEDSAMTFYHLCGGIKFTLEQPDITNVTLSGLDGEPLAGRVKVALDGQGHPVVQEVLEPATSVTLSCPGGFAPGTEYFFVTLPVQFQRGFRIDFGDGLTRTISAAMRVNRAKFQWSPNTLDCTFDGFPYEEFDIESAGVKAYIAEVDYSDDPGYTRTSADENGPYYATATDKPESFSLSWNGGNASRIVLSTSPLFTESIEMQGGSSPAKLINLVPEVTYYYQVLNASGSVLKQGAVRPKGQVRMIDGFNTATNSIFNVRDLGGWKADGGKRIAYGKLFRGSQLDHISDKGKDLFLNNLGITADLDLRGSLSFETSVGPVLPQLEYSQFPVLKFFGDGSGATQNLHKQAIRNIIGWLGNGEVIYFHCFGGADRTGTLAFLIEALLGVSESDLSKDYELTTFDKNHLRLRNSTSGEYQYLQLINYLRQEQFGYSETTSINELVYNWATSVTDDPADPDGAIPPLTPAEITLLRSLLLVQD